MRIKVEEMKMVHGETKKGCGKSKIEQEEMIGTIIGVQTHMCSLKI